MAKWRVNLRYSKDLSKIGELTQARSRSLGLILNKPGSGSFNHPMSTDYADLIQPYSTCVSFERYNWRSTLAWRTAGNMGDIWDWIWSGNVLAISENWTEDTMAVSCVGWASRLGKRMLRRDKVWTAVDDAAILQDVLAEMNLTTAPDGYAVPVVAGSTPATPTWMAWGGTLPNEGPGGATAYQGRDVAPINAPITLNRPKYTKANTIYDDVSGIEYGCDWWLDPKTRLVYCYRKRCTDRPTVIVAFRWGPNNLGAFERSIDSDQMANYFLTTGTSGTTAQYKDDTSSMATVGLLEETAALSDVGNVSILLANSGAEIIVRKNGKITYGITPFPYVGDIGVLPNAVPEPFVDYDPVGDQFRLSAVSDKRGVITRQTVRSFGVTVNIDDDGNEQLGQLQVAP
jgi:hypothetical protein